MADGSDDAVEIPLTQQRYFGAGLKRKRIDFVPASTESAAPTTASKGQEIAAKYLSIVRPKSNKSGVSLSAPPGPALELAKPICEICKAPIDTASKTPHEATIVHQISLEHTHPPSSLDRSRKGLAYLEKHGWDPDSRKGLGVAGEGILYPLKAKEKRDTVGLGIKVEKKSATTHMPRKLNAGAIQKLEEQNKKKHQKLHDMFYKNDELLKHLGQLG